MSILSFWTLGEPPRIFPSLSSQALETIRLQELEMENAKLKDQLDKYRKSIANSAEFEKQVKNANDKENKVNSKEASKIMLGNWTNITNVTCRPECLSLTSDHTCFFFLSFYKYKYICVPVMNFERNS